jgi:hypothetical protein
MDDHHFSYITKLNKTLMKVNQNKQLLLQYLHHHQTRQQHGTIFEKL